MRAAGLLFGLVLGALTGAAIICAGCATPGPVPPAPTDVFAGAVVDCETPEVQGEAPYVLADARTCLVGTATSACLVELAQRRRVDTIACVVRDWGTGANERVLAGAPLAEDTTIDNAARAFIQDHRIGYR